MQPTFCLSAIYKPRPVQPMPLISSPGMLSFLRTLKTNMGLVLTVLRNLPPLTRQVWRWVRDKKPLCFDCWKLWYNLEPSDVQQSRTITISKMKSDCPSCKIITTTLFKNANLNITESEQWLICEVDPGLSNLREFRPMSNWGTKIWISQMEDPAQTHFRNLGESEERSVCLVPEQIEASLLRSWIKHCENHGGSCAVGADNTARSSEIHDIILIDVHEKRLIRCPLLPAGSSQRFIALSYVWGRADFFKTTKATLEPLLEPGGLARPHVSLPKTFRDAMRLMELLGERYIWIDALCIVQDDRMKHDQLKIMDQIYGRAHLTIVALAGQSVHSGFPGLEPGTRSEWQLRGRFGRGQFVAAPQSLEQAIQCSNHFTRAWTFQETFLSRRCLFVSAGQFYFRCTEGYFSEGLNWQGSVSPGRAPELALALPFKWHRGIYEDAVEHYTRRNLSYDQDIVNAFIGAVNRMKEMGYCPRGDATMDLTCPTSLTWFSVNKDSPRRSNSEMDTSHMFPSWSWTGWKGPVTYASIAFETHYINYATTSLIWSHRVKYPGEMALLPLDKDPPDWEEFCTSDKRCSLLLQLPRGRPQSSSTLSDARLKSLHIFRFCASVTLASRFQFPSWQTYEHTKSKPPLCVALLRICDENGTHCGALFNPPVQSLRENDLRSYSLIALSFKKHSQWVEGVSASGYDTQESVDNGTNGCGCWLNFMLVKSSNKYHGVVERLAVGRMHPAAWALAQPRIEDVTMA